jgi:hypothetical protein
MKVIAINDAPIPKTGYYSGDIYLDRAYYKGDVFDLSLESKSSYSGFMVIWHDKIEYEMEVDSNNFITLDEWRNSQINKILK